MLVQLSPFQALLGIDFDRLPEPVRYIHALNHPLSTAGLADVTVAAGPLVWLLCRMAGLPRPGTGIPVTVLFHPDGRGGERWERKFADRRYASTIAAGESSDRGFLIEHFGLFDLQFRLTPRPDGLAWLLAGWRLMHIPLPTWALPQIACFEGADGARFTFDIDVAFPFIGHVIRYRGWLAPNPADASPTHPRGN